MYSFLSFSLLKNVSYSKTMPFAQIFSNIYQLAHTIVVARKPEIYGAGQQSETQTGVNAVIPRQNFLLQKCQFLLF